MANTQGHYFINSYNYKNHCQRKQYCVYQFHCCGKDTIKKILGFCGSNTGCATVLWNSFRFSLTPQKSSVIVVVIYPSPAGEGSLSYANLLAR